MLIMYCVYNFGDDSYNNIFSVQALHMLCYLRKMVSSSRKCGPDILIFMGQLLCGWLTTYGVMQLVDFWNHFLVLLCQDGRFCNWMRETMQSRPGMSISAMRTKEYDKHLSFLTFLTFSVDS